MSSRPGKGKPVIGIVGGIGAGKSTAAAEFAALGCPLIDGDVIGHELLSDSDVLRRIGQAWPEGIIGADGQVDRKALASRVFADPAELERLNRILHPRIRRRMARQIAEAQRDPAVPGVVVDAADLCTHLVFVSAPARERQKRASRRRGWTRETWRRREKSQISLDRKAAKCDYTIDNCLSVPHLREQIRQLFCRICPDVA